LLANDLTSLVHGEDAAASAIEASEAVFGGPVADLRESTFKMLAEELPTTKLDRSQLDEAENLIPLLVEAGAAASKSEAARLLKQNGIAINDSKVDGDAVINRESLHHDRFCLVRKGKKSMYLLDFDGS
jgi:tyrosyl-tRNA synthetase